MVLLIVSGLVILMAIFNLLHTNSHRYGYKHKRGYRIRDYNDIIHYCKESCRAPGAVSEQCYFRGCYFPGSVSERCFADCAAPRGTLLRPLYF